MEYLVITGSGLQQINSTNLTRNPSYRALYVDKNIAIFINKNNPHHPNLTIAYTIDKVTATNIESPLPYEQCDFLVIAKGFVANPSIKNLALTISQQYSPQQHSSQLSPDNLQRYIHGEYSFILFDCRKQCLIASRDHQGIEPLYTANLEKLRYISSSISCIFDAIYPVKPRLSPNYLLSIITCYYPDRNHTVYKNIQHVRAGHALVINTNTNNTTYHTIWKVPSPDYNILPEQSTQAYISQYNDALQEAVSSYTNINGVIYAELSGGIDSATVATLASMRLQKEQKHLSILTNLGSGQTHKTLKELESVIQPLHIKQNKGLPWNIKLLYKIF
jgi:hypothetical protein